MQTPLMTQYYQVKAAYPDTILLFRVGDFYETFEDDAKTASKVLGITLTRRANGAAGDVPLAGFPHHAIDSYLPKLVRAGYRVAICDQVENPKFAKGIVKREVTEVVTPGVAFSDKLLDHGKNNFLLSVFRQGENAGFSFCDASTGEFYLYESPVSLIPRQFETLLPAEVIVPKKDFGWFNENFSGAGFRITRLDDWIFSYDTSKDILLRHFGTVTLKGFGIDELPLGTIAAGSVLHYLNDTQKSRLSHIQKISIYNPTDYMALDSATKRNLEIVFSMNENKNSPTLITILDKTETPMGARLLKRWLSMPLIKRTPILKRLEAVRELYNNTAVRNTLRSALKEVGDLERLISRICTGRTNPRDLNNLKSSLTNIPILKEALSTANSEVIKNLGNSFKDCSHIVARIESAINENPPLNIGDGGVIRQGYSPELDELRELSFHGKDWIARLQKDERERTGISSLKVSYNRVFGYYIEISNANKDKIPSDYIRKQTLVNSERFITPELKEYEEKILNAEEKIFELESRLFNDLRLSLAEEADVVQQNAKLIAMLDCFASFAEVAVSNNYIEPEITEGQELEIIGGRHPVVEQILPAGIKFTPNDCILDGKNDQIIILTGPNMAGKSVYLRQTGLIVLMAQVGSFVPARSAKIGVVDRIFTRVGASDNISSGESTFLVEMQEAANILNNATPSSLILLDEIGRGTSTFDGISIAWSITEYIHENPAVCAKTIFATHYHELNEMAELFPRIKNYKVEVREYEDKVIFLHKVSPGQADHSYGIQVAMMAGLPSYVTNRAKEILNNLESKELTPSEIKKKRLKKNITDSYQLNLFELKDEPLREAITSLDINSLTPLEALNKLQELKKSIKN